ncbi:MAG: hypothetical protein HY777_12855 [Betaproteobacteria bacterium]|nr:hypothetical protein [Betaproteobacteria bacterium]
MKNLQTLILAAAATTFMLASPLLLAHSDDYLDTQKAPNGGQLRMAGAYHFELVVAKDSKAAKDNALVVHLTDHAGAKISSAGATGTATLLAGKSKVTATLVPDGENRLKGSAKYASMPDMKVVVSIALPGKSAEQARFTPLVVAKDEHMDHKH